MTPTLVRQHHLHPVSPPHPDAAARARDWAEIQERMLVPLYEAVHERLDVGSGTRLLGLGCGTGLALLMAAARGAYVTGTDADPQRLALARERLAPGAEEGGHEARTRLLRSAPEELTDRRGPAFNLVTAFDPQFWAGGDLGDLVPALKAAAALAERGSPVVLAGWGPAERCATSSVLRVASGLAGPAWGTPSERQTELGVPVPGTPHGWRPGGRDDLEDLAHRAGLRPDGSGRVACPFGYADLDSAVRGLLSTGVFDAAVAATDREQVGKELTEALHPHLRPDGTVWMPNVFRYLIARV
ncbi:methyltransferase domain-containing protein [Streptomyces sp. NPDC004647]|uniref:methyltransferase domain-containing protein n=1 Tax=Streptomyces sp. NPDC004647 TaxID=3154671 RepID=UPI0033BB77FA